MTLADSRGPYQVTVRHDLVMPTRDGAQLLTDLYVPEGPGPWPTLLRRTPYGKDRNDLADEFNEARWFASHGYLVAVQNTRGRFGSTGAWYPFAYEARDGYDAVEWVAARPESTGRVGTFGQSYGAIVQYLTATQRPPHLVTAVPVSAYLCAFENYWYNHGALELNWTLSYFANMAADALAAIGDTDRLATLENLKADPTQRFSPLTDQALRHLPLVDWVERFGAGAPFLADVAHHETDGPYWWALDLRRQFANIDVPMLHVGSWYDLANWDTPQFFLGLRELAMSERSRADQAMFLGPWAHLLPYNRPNSGGTGDIDFGPAAAFDMLDMEREWFDHFVRDDASGLPRSPVTVFVMGDNTWRDETNWPPDRADDQLWFLDTGCLSLVPPTSGSAATYRYDPADPVPTAGGRYVGGGVRDQHAKTERPDVLCYRAEPATERLEITGNVRLELFAATDGPDTDFVAVLCDVHPDGFVQNLAEGLVRCRFRNGYDVPQPMTPGESQLLTLDLGNLSHAMLPGHSLLLLVTSSDFPRWDRNLNTGESITRGTRMRVATQTVFHGGERPSKLILPAVIVPA